MAEQLGRRRGKINRFGQLRSFRYPQVGETRSFTGKIYETCPPNLLDRLARCEDCILAFLWDWPLPFTNNEAERASRMMKVRVKISGCFRTLEGARRHARILSYISTLRKHGLTVLE
jgi:transposase